MPGKGLVTLLLAVTLATPAGVVAQQANGDIWRAFAAKLDAGAAVIVRLHNGQRFHATLIDARADTLLVQPRTRRPVPPQPISYEAIVSLEKDERHGMSGVKAAAIGVGAGVGAFLGVLAIVAATID